jgi:hypothetical protein
MCLHHAFGALRRCGMRDGYSSQNCNKPTTKPSTYW